jgi:hypothetical protein
VLVTAVVTKPLRYVAVDRERFRSLLYEDAALSGLSDDELVPSGPSRVVRLG